MIMQHCIAAFVAIGLAVPVHALPPRRASQRSPVRAQVVHKRAELLQRAVAGMEGTARTAAEQRQVVACHTAHRILWDRFGVRTRIMAVQPGNGQSAVAVDDLTILHGLALCTAALARLSGDAEYPARAREAIAYYRTIEAVSTTLDEQLAASAEASLLEFAMERMGAAAGTLPPAASVASDPESVRADDTAEPAEPSSTFTAIIQAGFADFESGNHLKCYANFVALAQVRELEQRLEDLRLGLDRERLSGDDLDVLLGRARCAHGSIALLEDDEAQRDRLIEAMDYYATYATAERRQERAVLVREVEAINDALHREYYAMAEREAQETHPQPEGPVGPAVRMPVTASPAAKTPRERFLDRLAAGYGFLRLKLFRHSYPLFRALASEGLGKSHPDVAYGLAQSTELLCAALDDEAQRLTKLIEARGQYERYVAIETRTEHMRGSNARVPDARRAMRELADRIAKLEARRAGSLSVVGRDRVLSAVVEADADAPSRTQPATGNDDAPGASGAAHQPKPDPDAEHAARAAVERRDPALAAFVRKYPTYTWSQVMCFLEHGMAPWSLTSVGDAIKYVYDLPPPDTPCPPR